MTYDTTGADPTDDERPDGKRDRTARLLNVLGILQGSGDNGIRVEEIARRTSMSKRSAYRDLRALEQELKIPVWSEGGQWGVGKGAFLPPLQLTQPEATAVFLAARVVTRYADKYDANLASAFQKLAAALPDALREHVERTLRDLALRPVDPAFNRHVEDLTRAWAQRRVVRFRYAPAAYDGGDREPSWREVHPYLVEPSLQTHALYLIGLDETRGAMRTFKVERILDLSLTARTVRDPRGGGVGDAPPRLGHHRRPARGPGGPAVRAVRLGAGPRGDLAPEPVGHRRARTGRWSGGPRVSGTVEIRLWILAWGDDVEVLEPAALRAEVAATHARAVGTIRDDLTAGGQGHGGGLVAVSGPTSASPCMRGPHGRSVIAAAVHPPHPRRPERPQAAPHGAGSPPFSSHPSPLVALLGTLPGQAGAASTPTATATTTPSSTATTMAAAVLSLAQP